MVGKPTLFEIYPTTAKIIGDNLVNSEEFREIYRENIDLFKKLAEEFKNGHLSPKQYIIKTGQILK